MPHQHSKGIASFVEKEDARSTQDWVVVRRRTGHNWYVLDGFNAGVIDIDICSPKRWGVDNKIISKTTSVCIHVAFVFRRRVRWGIMPRLGSR